MTTPNVQGVDPLYENPAQFRVPEEPHHIHYPSAATNDEPIEYQYVDPQATDVGIESDWDDNSSVIPDQKKAKPENVILVNPAPSLPLPAKIPRSPETESELDWTSVQGKLPKPSNLPEKMPEFQDVGTKASPSKKVPGKVMYKHSSPSPARKYPRKAGKYKEKIDPIGEVFDALDADDDEQALQQLRQHFKRGGQTAPDAEVQGLNNMNKKDSPARPTFTEFSPPIKVGVDGPRTPADIIKSSWPADECETLMSHKLVTSQECIHAFFREIFTILSVITSTFIICFNEAIRFILFHIFGQLILNSLLYFTEVIFKPVLQVIWYGVISPVLRLVQSTCSALSEALKPLAGMCLAFMQPLIQCATACRLIVVEKHSQAVSQV